MKHCLIAILLAATVGCTSATTGEADERAKPKQMETALQTECREYLELGPPVHMDNYIPESSTEILIAHGAKGEPIDPELAEIGGIILMESSSHSNINDPEIRRYMQKGADLVKRVLEANN